MAKRSNNMPTMTDVAKLAGVSQSTVSLILNGKAEDSIPHTTRNKVLEASRCLGYRPNAMARALQGSASGVIGCISDGLITTDFAGNIIKGAQDVAWERGKVLMLATVDGRREVFDQAMDTMVSYQVECVLYITRYIHQVELPPMPGNLPLVLVNCYDLYRPTVSFIPDDYQGAYKAIEHLISLGHTRIGFINNNLDIPATLAREKGYLSCLSRHDIPAVPEYLVRQNISGKEVFDATRAMLTLKNRPTAILCFNDRSAISVYNAAASLNISIPDELSVIGHDDHTAISEFLVPGLTTMRLPHYEMGAEAMRFILENQAPLPNAKKKYKPSLVKRGSVAQAPAQL